MNQATKKNLKQFLIVLSLLAAIIAAVAIPLLATSDIRAEKKRLRENQYAINAIKNRAEITLPDDAEIVFNIRQLIFQDGTEYYVAFKFTEEPIKWLKDNNFSKLEDEGFEDTLNYFFRSGGWLDESVPQEYRPIFDEEYYWLETRGISRFVYMPNKLELIVHINSI